MVYSTYYFFTGVLFANLSDSITESNTKKKLNAIVKEGKLKTVFALSMLMEYR